MEKKYKNGLVLGKFLPPHRGHLYLIDTAIDNCDTTHIIACYNKNQPIPGDLRVETLKTIYKNNPNVIIHSFDDINMPQHEHECKTLDDFYGYWVPEVYKRVKELDVVFTSENYGDDFSRYLGIEHFLVDKERKNFPISGTKIRSNPFEHWKYIPDEIRPFFVKRIAIVGPESVGKSMMSKKLANYFNTNFVIEYGRTVYESKGKVDIDDFIPISEGRQSLEDWVIKQSNKVLFCDTEDITTYLFSKMYHPNEYKKVEDWFLDKINTKSKFDLYLLLKPDCEPKQDGTRKFLEERQEHYEDIKKELIKYRVDFIEVGGTDWVDRFNSCVEIVKSNYNI